MAEKDFMSAGATKVEDTRTYDELGNVIQGTYGYTPPVSLPNQSEAETKRLASHTPVSHSTTNSAPDSTPMKVEFIPNMLDEYDQYTYHWKFFITSLEAARHGEVLSTANQTIIAESGVTDLTIDKVELHGIATPSVETGTGTQTMVKFEIVEPSGAGLIDKIFYESVALGIGNWMVMPCFLQLEFRGRTPDTSASVESGAPGTLGALKWVWPIKLTNTKAHVSHVGTKYEFDAIIYNELAQSNSYFSIQSNMTLSNLTNFKSAMQRLEDKLNADQYEKLIENYSIPDSYKIVVDPKLYDAEIAKPNDSKSTAFGRDYINFNDKTASYNSGTSIDKIIDSLLGNSTKFQNKLQGTDTPTSKPKTANDATDQMKKLWRVITETHPIGYDSLRQDNAVEITIFVVEYDLGMTDVNASQTGQTPETLPAAKMRMAEYLKKSILKKQYNYIFTGLNDQIINFDLNMNFSFAVTMSRFGGIHYDSAINQAGVGVSKEKEADETKKASEQLRDVIRFINNAKPGENVDKKIKDAQDALNKAEIGKELKERYITLLANAKPEQRKKYVSNAVERGGILSGGGTSNTEFNTSTRLDIATANAKSLAELKTGTNSKGTLVDLKFISDVNINSAEAQNAYNTAISTRKGKLRPIPFKEGNQEATFSSVDPSNDSGRARTANVFASALHSSLDASLIQIKLTVKGDPYWLFPQGIASDESIMPSLANMSTRDAIESIKFSHKDPVSGEIGSANLYGTDNFILIRFRTPRIYNEVTSITDPYTEVETFSGVYKVIGIISKFEMGKFSQELSCILDPMINISDFPEFLSAVETFNGKPPKPPKTPREEQPDWINPDWVRKKYVKPVAPPNETPNYVNPSWTNPTVTPPVLSRDEMPDWINPDWVRKRPIKSGPGAGSSTPNISDSGAESNIPTISRDLK